MFLSVNIPVYNSEKYLRKCIDSVLEQTFSDFELILADDGSTDLSGAICDEYAASDERIKVLHLCNGGAEKTRRLGTQQSRGDYVFFMDSDDTIEPELFEKIHKVCTEHEPDMVCFNFSMKNGERTVCNKNGFSEGLYCAKTLEKVRRSLIYDPRKRSFNYGGVIYSLWSKAYRREFLQKYHVVLPQSIVKGEDMVLTAIMISAAKSVYFMDYCGYNYRITPGSVMNTFVEGETLNYKKVYRFLTSNVSSISKNSVAVWVMYMFLTYCRSAAAVSDSAEEFEKTILHNTDSELLGIIRSARLFLPKLCDIKLMRLAKKQKCEKLYYALKGERA